MEVTTLLLVLLAALIVQWIRERRKRLRIIQEIGLSGPKPGLLLGNYVEIGQKGLYVCLEEWTKKYGNTYGIYEGSNPVIVTSDVDFLKTVLIKEFHKFPDRKPFPITSDHDEYQDMFVAKGDKWRRLRGICSPSFSGKRMKEMSPLINEVIDRILLKLEDKASEGKPFNIQSVLQQMTLDVIGCCAFGIEVDSISNPKNGFLKGCRDLFAFSENPNMGFKLMSLFGVLFPDSLATFRKYCSYLPFPAREWLLDRAKDIITYRRENPTDRVDFIRLLLDKADEPNLYTSNHDNNNDYHDSNHDNNNDYHDSNHDEDSDSGIDSLPSTPSTSSPVIKSLTPNFHSEKKSNTLTLEEMQGQCFIFIIAGYETTSTTLAFLAYELALNPDIQVKLQQEIDRYFPENDIKPDYKMVQKLPYTDMVLSETLRLHPIATIATSRQCCEATTVEGLHVPAGVSIQVNMPAIHMDPNLWGPEDPKLFVPERFLPERKNNRHPLAWLAFGAGPRQCIGTRFALMETKIALVRMLKHYSFKRCDLTKVPLPVQPHSVTGPSEGVYVTLEKRLL